MRIALRAASGLVLIVYLLRSMDRHKARASSRWFFYFDVFRWRHVGKSYLQLRLVLSLPLLVELPLLWHFDRSLLHGNNLGYVIGPAVFPEFMILNIPWRALLMGRRFYYPLLRIDAKGLRVRTLSLDLNRYRRPIRVDYEIPWSAVHLVGITRKTGRLKVWTQQTMPDEINVVVNWEFMSGIDFGAFMHHSRDIRVMNFPLFPMHRRAVLRLLEHHANAVYAKNAWWAAPHPHKAGVA